MSSKKREIYVSDLIAKRRKTSSGDTERQDFNQSISEEMKQNIENTFQDQIKQLIKDSTSLTRFNSSDIDSESILAKNSISVKRTPCYTKAFEDSVLRPPLAHEQSCQNKEKCECRLMALTDPNTDDEQAFVGVALPEKHNMCLLCTRKKVSQLYYHYLITQTCPDTCIQPHYNIIEKRDEYDKNNVFLPSSMTGITDPFVMHNRHNYYYDNKRIIQNNSINFTQASMMCNSKTFFLKKHNGCMKKIKCTEAQYFEKINSANDFKEKYRLEMNLYLNIPDIYDKLSSIRWEQIITSILDASVYLPIIFGSKITSDKTTKNIPIIHIISKGLPQRSQFRNFVTLSLDCLEKSKEFNVFFKQLFVWSLTGVHYKWNTVCIPLSRRLQLFDLCCIQHTDWAKIVTLNVRLFFFMIKEYLCYIIKNNPGLHDILTRWTHWSKYEQEIFSVMNEVRHLYATCDLNPLKQMMSLTQKLLPRPNTVNWPKNCQLEKTLVEQNLHEILQKKNCVPCVTEKMETLSEYKDYYQTLKLKLSVDEELCVILRKMEMSEDNNVIEHHTKKIFLNQMFVDTLLNSIHEIVLPAHQIENQLNVSIKRHDLNPQDEKFVKTLYNVTTYFFCIGCQDCKACYDYGQKKKETTIYSYGHNKLARDPFSNKSYCMGTNTRRKNRVTSCMAVPCIKISLFGKIVSFFGKSFTLCSLCGTLCSLRINESFLNKGMIACGNCTQQQEEQEFCGYCVRKSSSLVKYRIFNDDDEQSDINPWSTISLCPRHRSTHWHSKKILLKSVLFENLKRKI